MKTAEKGEFEIDFRELLFVILEKLWVIILGGLLLGAAALLFTQFLLTPQYTSTTSLYVMNRQDENQLTTSDISVSTTLTSDFEILVTSRTVLEQVIEEVGLNTSAEDLASKISVNNPADSRILEVSVEDDDAYTAKQIADALAVVASEQIVTLLGIEKVNIIDKGNIPFEPTSPSLLMNVAIGAAAGILLSILIILLIYILDDSIKTSEDVEQHLGVSVLGMIPISSTEFEATKKKRKKRSASVNPA